MRKPLTFVELREQGGTAPPVGTGRITFGRSEVSMAVDEKSNVSKKIEEAIERERERRRVFVNGFFWGAALVLWLIQIVKFFAEKEKTV